MDVDFSQAMTVFTQYQDQLPLGPCIDPHYVMIDAKRDSALIPTFFIYKDNENFYYHGFHKTNIPNTPYYDVQSPFPYGGPIATTNNINFINRAFQAYQEFCKKQNIIVEFIRFHPLLENWRFYTGEVTPFRKTIWVDLTPHDLLRSYCKNRVRTAIRKSIKNGVKVIVVDGKKFFPKFKELYYETILRLKTTALYHFNDDYLGAMCTWEKAYLTAAIYHDNIVAMLLSLIKGHILELHLIGLNKLSNTLCATNLIYHEAFTMAKTLGCTAAHFGGGNSSDENKDSLLFLNWDTQI